MANTALAHSTLEQLNSLSQLHIVRQFGFMLLLAAGIALGTAVVMWSRDADYAVLYPDLGAQDGADVLAALDQSLAEYRVDSRTGLITVPAAQLQQLRLQLASQGLPRSSASGFDMLYSESSLGTSNFIEQARYNRALEQELVKTIKLIRGVRDARIHLSIPRQSTFLRSANRASASVMLDIIAGQIVNDIQIAGIAHLVASGVAGLDSEDVSIVDQKGNLLSRRQDSEFASSAEHLQYTRNLEQEYSQRIMDILTPVVGEGNIRAQVTADLDFTTIETTEENYNPANVVIRSEQTTEETRGAAVGGAALSPVPPVLLPDGSVAPATPPAAAASASASSSDSSSQNRTNATRNYEIDKSVSYTRSVPGGIRRLSVAVLVDLQGGQAAVPPATEADTAANDAASVALLESEKLARLTRLVKDTIGFSELRGDSVNVISERFSVAPLFEPAPAPALWEQAWVPAAAKQLAASIVVLLLIFMVLRPALKSVVSAVPPRQASVHLALTGAEATPEPRPAKKAPARSEFDENLTLAQTLVENEPARAARMIKEWVAND